MSQFPSGLPGVGANALSLAYRRLTTITPIDGDFLPGGRLIDGANTRDPDNTIRTDEIRGGLLLGKITSSGLLAASVIGVTQAATLASATSLTLTAAAATELVRRNGTSGTFKLIGPPSAGGTNATQTVTYSAVNTSTGVVTCSAISAATIAGSVVGAGDGSETPITFVFGPTPIRVTDVLNASMTTPLDRLYIGDKPIYTTNLVNYPSDTTLKAWLKAGLRTINPGMVFDDDMP